MRLRAAYQINGMRIAGPEAWSYGDVFDGNYVLRFPPIPIGDANGIAAALSNPASLVAVEVTIDGLPTVAEIETRLATVEKAIRASREPFLTIGPGEVLRDLGMWLPRGE